MKDVENNPEKKITESILQLVNIMAALRHPETGCPWDIEQDFTSIAPYTIEEAYEVVDAIEKSDFNELKNELGDLLLQVIFHSQMAQEKGLFDFSDVIAAISQKMIGRHPHVFAANKGALTSDEQSRNWEDQKAAERQQKAPSLGQVGALDGIAKALPALMRAQKLQKRAARTGFDWPDAGQAAVKVQEELAELFDAQVQGDEDAMHEEAGDLLFSCVNVIRKLGIDAEDALRSGNEKFMQRFRAMEALSLAQGDDFKSLSLEQQDTLWRKVKAHS